MSEQEENTDFFEELLAQEPGGAEFSHSADEIVARFTKLAPDQQAEAAERLVKMSSTQGVPEIIDRLFEQESTTLPALISLARHKQDKGDDISPEMIAAMRAWLSLCEEDASECDPNDFFWLPGQVREAIIRHLASWMKSDLLEALKRDASDREGKKRIAKAIHRAKSAGAQLPLRSARAFVMPEQEEHYDEAWVAPPDSTGTMFSYLFKTMRGRNHLFVILASDQEGIIKFEGYQVSRPRFDKILESTKKNPHAIIVKVEPGFARRLVREAEESGRRRGRSQNEDYLASRRSIGIVDEPEVPHPVWEHFDQDELKGERGLVNRSAELLDHRMFESWRIMPLEEGRLIADISEMRKGPLQLSLQQQKQRERELIEKEAERAVQEVGMDVWKQRLLTCAYLLQLMGEEEKAKMAAAAGLAVEDPGQPLPPLFVELMNGEVERAMAPDDEGPQGPDMGRGGIVVP